MAEDHGLCDGDCPIDVTECRKLVLFIIAEHIILLNGVQGLLLPLQFDDVGIWNDPLSELPHRVLKGRKLLHMPCSPLNADALVLMALCGYHNVSLVQHEHSNLLGHSARSTNNYLLLDLAASKLLTFIATNSICQFHFRVEPPHLLHHFACLQGELIGWRNAQTLERRNTAS
uniref:Uncharacterized protein n=1 Tax=Pygocentrus nattereri TaxID=42514 RepID=A0A3B4CZW6_PYGNA